jgi:hypothetical protein
MCEQMNQEEVDRIEKMLSDLGVCTFQGRKVVLNEEICSTALNTSVESRYDLAMNIVAERRKEKGYPKLGDDELDKVAHYLATIFWVIEKKREEGKSANT